MQPSLEFTIYPGRANTIELELTDDGKPIDHTLLSRVDVVLGGQTFDSLASPALFDLTRSTHIELKLAAAGLTAGRYSATLIVYDTVNYVGGFVWPVNFVVIVKAI